MGKSGYTGATKWKLKESAHKLPPRAHPTGSPAPSASIRFFKRPIRLRPGRQRHLRARRTHRLAHASSRSDPHRHRRLWMGPARGRPDRRDPSWRRRLVPARRKALAWRDPHHRHDPHRHSGKVRRQSRRVDGARHRRAIPEAIKAARPQCKRLCQRTYDHRFLPVMQRLASTVSKDLATPVCSP